MKAQEILTKGLNYWPSEIDVSDGRILENNGFISDNLSAAWDIAEEKAKGNDWDELVVWIIYSLLHKKAKANLKNGESKVHLSEINETEFKTLLLDNLKDKSYKSMLSEFIENN